jgi:hypothetical protein
MLFSYGANKDHGLRRSTADKQKSIRGMLADFGDWSDSKIGRHVGVDHKTVAVQRAAILGISQDAGSTRMVERNGKAYLQEISKIGKTVGNAPLGSPSNDAAKTKGVPEPETTRVIPVPVENAEIAEVDTLTEATIDVSNIYDELLKEKERNLVLQNENEHLKKRITDLENELQTTQRSGGVTACNNESLNSVDSNGAD